MENPIKIGISSCLMGHKVRYDGGHKHDSQLTDTFGRMFALVLSVLRSAPGYRSPGRRCAWRETRSAHGS